MTRKATPNALVPYAAEEPASGIMSFQGHRMRHTLIDGEPWFVAADACRCLGLGMEKGTHPHTHKLSADERQIVKKRGSDIASPQKHGGIFSGMENTHVLISESGLYKIALRAHRSNPDAKAFQDWVTREVLPSIRKTGGYLVNEDARATAAVDPRMPTSMADALRKYADEVERREEAEKLAAELQAARALDAPKVESCA